MIFKKHCLTLKKINVKRIDISINITFIINKRCLTRLIYNCAILTELVIRRSNIELKPKIEHSLPGLIFIRIDRLLVSAQCMSNRQWLIFGSLAFKPKPTNEVEM